MGSLHQAIFHTTDLIQPNFFFKKLTNSEIILLPQFDGHKDFKKIKNFQIVLTATVPLPDGEINYF